MLLALFTGCAPLARDWPERMDYPILEADQQTAPPDDITSLRVMAWNIKFGAARIDFWFDGFGDRTQMTETEVLGNMDDVRAMVAAFDPDLAMMEEIEVGSKRSAYVDMVDNVLNDPDLGFNYAAYVPNWQVAYIPDHGLGKVDMGNALFSKYPIKSNVRIDLGPQEDQDGLTKYFYLDRCILEAVVDLPSGPMTVLVNHPDAYSTDGTKIRQLEQTFDEASGIEGDVIIGGDLNAIPPGSLRVEEFADESDVSGNRGVGTVTYVGQEDELVPWFETWEASDEHDHLDGRPNLDAYAEATTEDEQVALMSHSIDKDTLWTQRLDYLFSNRTWTEGWVVRLPSDGPDHSEILDPMTLSDHAPVWGVMDLR